jgi:hypothetical protein
VATEPVQEVDTAHISGTISVGSDLRRLAGPAGSEARALMTRLGLDKEGIDLWIDGRGNLRRERLTMEGRGVSMLAEYTFSKFGERVTVSAPPASQTAPIETLDEINH